MKSYTVQGKSEKFETLILDAEAAMPQVADNQVLVRVKAISLNYRDIVVAKGTYPFGFNHGVVPCSDGAGHVVEVGKSVTRFAVGDNVITTFYSKFIGGEFTMDHSDSAIGATADGTLREYGAFDENALVPMPAHLTFEEASTLTCVGVTAWNALYGIPTKAIKAGDVVLIQGTGGVSIFALQLAKAAGCTVIATTSTDEKAQVLRSLGADHIINYKRNSDWGVKAKEIVPQGVDHVLEVGGPKTMAQSLQAIRPDGVITIIGFVGGEHNGDQPTFLDVLQHACVVRGILVGSRVHFEELIKAVEAHKLKPVVDKKRFTLQEAPDAFQYLYDQKHIGKLCISVE